MDKRLLLLGGLAGGVYLLARQPSGPGGLPTIRQSQTAASYDASGHPIPWPLGAIVRVDIPGGGSYRAVVVAG